MKVVFPIIWFGALCTAFLMMIAGGALTEKPLVLLAPALMALAGYVYHKTNVWPLADGVYDCGDYLLFRMRHEEQVVPISDIIDVRYI